MPKEVAPHSPPPFTPEQEDRIRAIVREEVEARSVSMARRLKQSLDEVSAERALLFGGVGSGISKI